MPTLSDWCDFASNRVCAMCLYKQGSGWYMEWRTDGVIWARCHAEEHNVRAIDQLPSLECPYRVEWLMVAEQKGLLAR